MTEARGVAKKGIKEGGKEKEKRVKEEVIPPPGVFFLLVCWLLCGGRSLQRPLPGRRASRPAGGAGRWGSVRPSGPDVTHRAEAPPPGRESQDELRKRHKVSFFTLLFYFLSLFPFPPQPLTLPLSSLPPALSLSAVMWRRGGRRSSCRTSRGGSLIDRSAGGGATSWRRWSRREQGFGWKREKEMWLFFNWC